MTLLINIPSLFIGFVIGYTLFSFICLKLFYDERWDDGFGTGWKAGKKFIESHKPEQNNANNLSVLDKKLVLDALNEILHALQKINMPEQNVTLQDQIHTLTSLVYKTITTFSKEDVEE